MIKHSQNYSVLTESPRVEVSSSTVGLDGIGSGRHVVVRAVGDHPDAARLAEIGFEHGRRLQVIRGGDPMICRVDGARVALGRALARCIHVEVLSGNGGLTPAIG